MTPTWISKIWLGKFLSAKTKDDINACYRSVFENTHCIVTKGCFMTEDGTVVRLTSPDRLPIRGELYQQKLPYTGDCKCNNKLKILVMDEDCLVAARKLTVFGDVCILNNASRKYPGGSVIYGPGAQEEYLCKCSNYYIGLFPFASTHAPYSTYVQNFSENTYPLDKNSGCCYVANVTVFRDKEETGYQLIEKPWKMNVIAVPALDFPKCIKVNGENHLCQEDEIIVLDKIRTIFRIAKMHQQKNLVLSAWGCGAYKNPPKHIAELFKRTISIPEFCNFFNNITFAISCKDTNNNYEIFKSVLIDNN